MSAGSLAAEQLEQCLRTACSELSRGLREGQDLSAEDFLERQPALAKNSELALELIYTEYVVREELGQPVAIEQWFERFPQWINDLKQLLEVHRQLCVPESMADAGSKWQTLSRSGSTATSSSSHRTAENTPTDHVTDADSGEQLGRIVGNYQLLEEIGRGGMGVVYRARQLNLQRDVALKMILSGEFASPREMTRFQTEAQSTARLHHPHIVQVHEVGAHRQRPFLSMELMTGGGLDAQLKQALPNYRDAASLLETVARAVHYAHEQGIIHRDLKPSNVLLDEHGQPKVADFGLAKQLQTGQEWSRSVGLVGTLNYMAPELAASSEQPITCAADVYSLGVILYEMLSGRTPFAADNHLETLRQIAQEEPPQLNLLRTGLPRDLETICLKCLHKEPRRRYESAQALADDLKRFTRGEPIKAKPVSLVERAIKWTRRRPLESAFIAVLMISLVAVSLLWRNAVASDSKAQSAAIASLRMREIAERERAKSERSEYFHRIGQAFGDYRANMVGHANQLLDSCPEDLRHFEWHYLKRKCNEHLLSMQSDTNIMWSFAVSPDGNYVASGSGEWGRARPGYITLFDAHTGQKLKTIAAHDGPVMALAFSPDSRSIASASFAWENLPNPGVKVWDLNGELLWRLPEPAHQALSLAFSPDGRRLAVGDEGQLQLWDLKLKRLIRLLPGHKTLILDLDFDPSGELIASAGRDGLAIVHHWPSHRQIYTSANLSDVRCVSFSPDGQWLAYSNYAGSVYQKNLCDDKAELKTHCLDIGAVTHLDYGPDGQTLAVCSNDGGVVLLQHSDGAIKKHMVTHNGSVRFVNFADDGRKLFTGGMDGKIKLWDLQLDGKPNVLNFRKYTQQGAVARVRVFPKSDRILMAIGGNHAFNGGGLPCLIVCHLKDYKMFRLANHVGSVTDATENADGSLLAMSSLDQHVSIWNGEAYRWQKRIKHPAPVTGVCTHPSGEYFLSVCADGSVSKIDWITHEIVDRWQAHDKRINEIQISSDGLRAATASSDGLVRVWDLATNRMIHELAGHQSPVLSVKISNNSKLIASAGEDCLIRLWSMVDGSEVRTLRGHSRQVMNIGFSSDDERLVSCASDWLTKVWDVQSGEEALWLREANPFHAVAFHPDSKRLFATRDSILHIYDGRSGVTNLQMETPRPIDLAWHEHQASAAREVGNARRMMWHYSQLQRADASSATHFFIRGTAHAYAGNWQQAAADFDASADKKSKATMLPLFRALTHLLNEDKTTYRQQSWQYLNSLKPGSVPALEIEAMRMAMLLDESPARAVEMRKRLESMRSQAKDLPSDEVGNLQRTYAWLLYRTQQFSQAATILENGIDQKDVSAEDILLKALLALQNKDLQSSSDHLRRADTLHYQAGARAQRERQAIMPWFEAVRYDVLRREVEQKQFKLSPARRIISTDWPLYLTPSLRPLIVNVQQPACRETLIQIWNHPPYDLKFPGGNPTLILKDGY